MKARDTGQNETRVRASADHPEETKQTLTRTELTTVPGTADDPLKVLQNLPGVARAPFGLGLLVVRGANPNSTGVFIGGEPVPLLYHFLAGPSVFSAFLIDKIDFYPGGFGVRYGRFAGGAVDVTIASDVGKTLHGAADINVRDSSAFISGPLPGGVPGQLRFPPQLHRPAAAALHQAQGRLDLRHPRRRSTTTTRGAWTRIWPEAAACRWSLFGSSDTFNVIAQDPTRMLTSDTHIGFNHVMGEWLTTFAGWSSRLASTYGYGDQSFSTGTFAGYQRYHRLYVARGSLPPAAPHAGADGGARRDPQLRLGQLRHPAPARGTHAGAHDRPSRPPSPARCTTPPPPPTSRRSGTRCRRCAWSPACASITTASSTRTSGRSTRAWRCAGRSRRGWRSRPARASTTSCRRRSSSTRSSATPTSTSPGPTSIRSASSAASPTADDLTATLFYVRRHDLPVASVDHFSSLGQGRSYGLELLLRHQITQHFYGWLAYTLSRTEVAGRLADDIPMGNMGMPRNGADLTWRPGQFDQTHNLVLVASYRWNAKWQTGFTYRLTTGTPRTPIVSSFYDADFNGYTRINGPPNSARNPTFSQLDLRVERTWTFDYWVLGVYLDVQNVLNRENPEGTLYDYRFQESASLRGLPILPILGVRGRF